MTPRQSTATVAATHVVCPRCRTVNRLPAGRPAEKAKCGSCHARLFDGNAIVVDEAGFEKHLRDDDIPILVDMWAPWCGPCRTMAPLFEGAAQALEPEVRLLKLNVDEAQKTASRLGIRGIPALFLFRNGRVLAQTAGVQNTDAIVRWTRAQLASPHSA
jgi:thioredoxin 2